jgi:hypothetical protein
VNNSVTAVFYRSLGILTALSEVRAEQSKQSSKQAVELSWNPQDWSVQNLQCRRNEGPPWDDRGLCQFVLHWLMGTRVGPTAVFAERFS